MHNLPFQPDFRLGTPSPRWKAPALRAAVDLSDSRRRRGALAESGWKCRGLPCNSVYFKTAKAGIGCSDKMHSPHAGLQLAGNFRLWVISASQIRRRHFAPGGMLWRASSAFFLRIQPDLQKN